jgi:hypothetical protein
MERSRNQNENGVKSIKIEDGIGNVEANGEYLSSLDVAGGTSAEGAGRSSDIECPRKHRGGRREPGRPLNASISDRYKENDIDNIFRTEVRM